MNTPDEKREIDALMHEIPASSIPVVKPQEKEAPIRLDSNAANVDTWGSKSNRLLADYKYGEGLALYGDNDLTTHNFFKRLSGAICAIVSNEHQKAGMSSEVLKPHYAILDACFNLIAKEIEKKELKDYEVASIIASLHGFVTNYNQRKAK